MGVTATVLAGTTPPQVGVVVTGLDATATVTVQASTDGLAWQTVRGANRLVVNGGSTFVRDFVPALNVPTTYRVVVATGTTPTPSTAVVTATSPTAWIQDPMDPATAVAVDCLGLGLGLLALADSFATLTRAQAADVAQVQGTRVPVASVGARQAPSRVALHLRADLASQDEQAATLRALLDNAGVVVLRGFPLAVPIDPVSHAVASLQESPVVGSLLGVRNDWALDMTMVRPTTASVAIAWWTYAEVHTIWAPDTYAAVKAARPGSTYLDWSASPERP